MELGNKQEWALSLLTYVNNDNALLGWGWGRDTCFACTTPYLQAIKKAMPWIEDGGNAVRQWCYCFWTCLVCLFVCFFRWDLALGSNCRSTDSKPNWKQLHLCFSFTYFWFFPQEAHSLELHPYCFCAPWQRPLAEDVTLVALVGQELTYEALISTYQSVTHWVVNRLHLNNKKQLKAK